MTILVESLLEPTSETAALPMGPLSRLSAQPADPLLSVIGAFRADPRSHKIDVGVGVFRNEAGQTPVFAAVKAAEARLLETQATKAYLGPEGDIGFFEALKPFVLAELAASDRVFGLQTPGGTGALRLAAELAKLANPGARVFIGTPSWPNHAPILAKAGLEQVAYPFFDVAAQAVRFEQMLDTLENAQAGDIALLQVCCHNPTGGDLTLAQWDEVARLLVRRGVLPLLDLAYQGLGVSLEDDAAGVRIMLDYVPEALIAYSCDKNFGLYRERTGVLFGIAANGAQARVAHSNVLALARANWSMPPDHGAAAVRLVLEDAALTADWRAELTGMCRRIGDMRALLAGLDPMLASLAGQHGMFSTLPLSSAQVTRLREEHAIYMPQSGRINVAGLTAANAGAFVAALRAVL